jgi:hypothetical protein
MAFAFDLISDLHLETWPVDIVWEGLPTSPVCVVAGDVCRDRDLLVDTLYQLGQAYQIVFYIDGNDEHKDHYSNLGYSYADLVQRIQGIPNVVYLQDNVGVVDGVAILGTNGWWGFDFDLTVDATACGSWYKEKFHLENESIKAMARLASQDAAYLFNSVQRLQTHPDIQHIVMVTHTAPNPDLLSHDIGIAGRPQFNILGNRHLSLALAADTEKKIHTWCFGHYHGSVDQIRSGVRYVNNCRGRGDTNYGQYVYYPRRIVID